MAPARSSRKQGLILGTGLVLIAAGAVVAWRLWTVPAEAFDAEEVALGREVYMAHCASCHGADLEGEPDWQTPREDGRMPAPPHDATGHTWHHPDAQLVAMTRHGIEPFAPDGYESDMPAFEGVLDDGEMRAVITFIKTTWPPEILEVQQRIDREFRQRMEDR
jgi:mono/diheme cytochrome c family protein